MTSALTIAKVNSTIITLFKILFNGENEECVDYEKSIEYTCRSQCNVRMYRAHSNINKCYEINSIKY